MNTNTNSKPVTYTSAITGKTYTLPAFYSKTRNTEKVCNSDTAELLATYIYGDSSRRLYRVTLYRRPRGVVREFKVETPINRTDRYVWINFVDLAPDDFAAEMGKADTFNGLNISGGTIGNYWKKLFSIGYKLPKFGAKVPKDISLRHVVEWRVENAVKKSIARHARKLHKAEMTALRKTIANTAANIKAGQPAKQEQLKLELPAEQPAKKVNLVKPVKPVEVKPAPVAEKSDTNKIELVELSAPTYAKYTELLGQTIYRPAYKVILDTTEDRIRVALEVPNGALMPAVVDAGYYYSKVSKTYNKKLNYKNYKKTLELMARLDRAVMAA